MIEAVVFDLGGVLIDWDPRYLYRSLFHDERQMETFLSTVATPEWNERQDLGRPFADGIAELADAFPQHADLIAAYRARWDEMLAGEIEGATYLLEELFEVDVPLYALTNWSAETFPVARRRFPWLGRFRGVIVSGEEGIGKPDPRIFELVLSRFGLRAGRTLFVDDLQVNLDAAERCGFQTLRFTTSEQLRAHLAGEGLLPLTRR
jgi:2-haloacid dehalogenase